MEKTQKILKRFISLILTFAISFGSYVFPVFAALPENNEAPTIEEVVDAYGSLKTKGQEVNTKIGEINATNPAPDSAKAKAVAEVEDYLDELNSIFNNDATDPIEYETLIVKTTKFNVINVLVDFKLSDLGITLTNETMKKQILTDTYSVLQEYYYQLSFMQKYLENAEKEDAYFDSIDKVSNKFETVSMYIEKLDQLKITYDKDLFETYTLELAKLMIVEETEKDIDTVNKLSDDLDIYTDSIKEILRKGLLEKYTSFKNELDNTTLISTEIDDMKVYVNNIISELGGTNYDLQLLSGTYTNMFNRYKDLVLENEKSERPEEYIDSKIEEINTQISETFGLNITAEQIDLINEMVEPNILNGELSIELLVQLMDQDELSDKLISEELSYDVLEAFVELYNNHYDALEEIDALDTDLPQYAQNIDDAVENDIFGENGGYIETLNSIENVSKTDKERLEILNKLDLIELSIMFIGSNFFPSSDDEAIIPITEKIEELREKFSKSCDNTLSSLNVNGIDMDVLEETYKIYVGNDVTELKVLFNPSNEKATVEVLKAKNLKVGTNEVIVVVTAENGEVRQYVIEVIRAEAAPVVTTTENKTEEEVKTITLNNSVVEDTEIEEDVEKHKNTSDSNEKYNEEVEEEGLSALTVLLIVIGIGLVGYGVYKVFGDKEDQKIEKAFEQNKNSKNKNIKSKKRR